MIASNSKPPSKLAMPTSAQTRIEQPPCTVAEVTAK